MRVAGVRLQDGDAIWVDAGELTVELLDRVEVRQGERAVWGTVFATPEQLIGAPEAVGVIVALERPAQPDPECSDLPGSDLPPLGTGARAGAVSGIVTAVDVVHRRVTIRGSEGTEVIVPVDEVSQRPP